MMMLINLFKRSKKQNIKLAANIIEKISIQTKIIRIFPIDLFLKSQYLKHSFAVYMALEKG